MNVPERNSWHYSKIIYGVYLVKAGAVLSKASRTWSVYIVLRIVLDKIWLRTNNSIFLLLLSQLMFFFFNSFTKIAFLPFSQIILIIWWQMSNVTRKCAISFQFSCTDVAQTRCSSRLQKLDCLDFFCSLLCINPYVAS
jgi:folate-binding Fe-S cluster repair protein YgfZ